MAFTADDLDRINRAIASGQRRVTFGDRTVEYRDVSEMLRAKSEIQKDLAGAVQRTRVMRYKGF